MSQRRLTTLFGKVYVWVRATHTGQWRLLPADAYLDRGEGPEGLIWL